MATVAGGPSRKSMAGCLKGAPFTISSPITCDGRVRRKPDVVSGICQRLPVVSALVHTATLFPASCLGKQLGEAELCHQEWIGIEHQGLLEGLLHLRAGYFVIHINREPDRTIEVLAG